MKKSTFRVRVIEAQNQIIELFVRTITQFNPFVSVPEFSSELGVRHEILQSNHHH